MCKYVLTMIIDIETVENEKKVDSEMMRKFIESKIQKGSVNEKLYRVGKCVMNIKDVKLGVTKID